MDLEQRNVNALRMLAVDMIERAKSGHPGIALSAAPTLYALYSKHLNVDPEDDKNLFRDRFVLSAGHGSSILYATLHAFGYKISIEDLKNFRKLGSITPGHPEYGLVPGVDTSTGPLGQGVATAVGMALSERIMANRFNKSDLTLFDNYTYALVGEGCLMEGVSYEALSLAGTLKLNKLIILYDCNKITLDSDINGVMNQNVLAYVKSLNFNTLEVEDGNDVKQINQALTLAKQCKDKPTFIKINTRLGFASVYENSNKAHGSVLGSENVELLRKKLEVKSKPFEIDVNVARDFVFLRKRFDSCKKMFKEKLKVYSKAYPGDYKLLKSCLNQDFSNLSELCKDIKLTKEMSGRDIGNIVFNKIASLYPNIVCGSADVSGSTKVIVKENGFINDNFSNRNIKFGIREFGMSCISTGMALYGGIIPVQSTFLVFSDYLKSSLRLASLMKQRVISVFTHDSIAVGEDGATHQSCEHLWGLRNIPRFRVFRPCNLNEIIMSYQLSLEYQGPSSIALSRQVLKNVETNISEVKFGGYIIAKETHRALNAVIVATGSEVSLAMDIKNELNKLGYNIRVVSMPCVDLFEEQSEKYQNSIIPKNIKSIFTIEAGSTSGWGKITGRFGKSYGVDEFGASASAEDMFKKFNLTKEYILKDIVKIIKSNKDKIMSIYE